MIACIRIPYFAVTLARSSCPDQNENPLILAQYKGGRGKVYAACEKGVSVGVKVGMSLSRARAICPEAVVEMASPSHTRRGLENLLQILSDYSQWIEAKRHAAQTAILYVDIGKLMPKEGQGIAQQIIERLLAEGFKASIGLASGKFTAYVAATVAAPGEVKLVKKGDEAVYLAHFSTAYLPLDTETARRFELLGLRRIGQVVVLPRPALIEQFGRAGGQLHQLASGEDTRRVAKYIAPLNKVVSRQFDPPLSDRLILESVLALLAGEVSAQLLRDGFACQSLLLTLHLDNHSEQEVESLVREPISSSGHLYRTVQPLLDRLKISCPITDVALRVGKLAPIQPRQLSLFDQPQADALENILLQLTDRYGEDCFYRVEAHMHPARLPELQFRFELLEVA